MRKIIRKIRYWLALKLIPKNERTCISLNVEDLPTNNKEELELYDKKIKNELFNDMLTELCGLIKWSVKQKSKYRVYRAEFPLIYDKRKEEK